MKKKSTWISLLVIIFIALSYLIVDIQYKPDLSAFSKKNATCYVDSTLKDVLPQEKVLTKNPFGKTKNLTYLNENGEVIDLSTPIVNLIPPDQVKQFMTRLDSGLDSNPIALNLYIRPILKLEPLEYALIVKANEVVIEPLVLNFKTDIIPEHYVLSYQGKLIQGPSNPWAGTDDFNLFKIVGQPFIRRDLNNVYYINSQDKKVFNPANIEKVVFKLEGDKADAFSGDYLKEAFNSLPLNLRYFALQDGLSIYWKDFSTLSEEDIDLNNEGYVEDKVKSVKEYKETRMAYYNAYYNAIVVNNDQGMKRSFSYLFDGNGYYYTVEGNVWDKTISIYNLSELKQHALKSMKRILYHEYGHFIDDNISSYYISEKDLKVMKDELPYGYKGLYEGEVIATAFEVYFTEQKRMKKEAPTAYKVCEDLIKSLDTSLADELVKLTKNF